MEFLLGLLAGVALAVVVAALAFWWLVRDRSAGAPDNASESAPEVPGAPVAQVTLTELFLDHQLRAIVAGDVASVLGESGGRLHVKLEQATLDLKPDQRAHFTVRLGVTALNFHMAVRPTAELAFLLQRGRVRLAVERVLLAGFTVPRPLVERIVQDLVKMAEAKLDAALSPFETETGVRLSALETTEDTLTLLFVEPPPGERKIP